MRVSFFACLLVAVAASVACAEDPQPTEAPSLSAGELSERLESGPAPLVIDVRSAEEYSSGHIPGAVNVPFDQVAKRIGDLEAPHGVALYCMVGPRARKGESSLLEAGYEKVFHLEGGLAAWRAAGLPVESTR